MSKSTALRKFVQEQYHLLGEDREKFLTNVADDVEWTVNGPAELAKCGSFAGRDGIREFFKKLEENWQFAAPLELIEIFEVPHLDLVIARTKECGINQKSRQRFVAHGTHLWKIEVPIKSNIGGKADWKVKGFLEYLVVWDGEEEISKIPKINSFFLGSSKSSPSPSSSSPSSSSTVDDEAKKERIGLEIDPGSIDKNVLNGEHFGIHGGDPR